MRNAIIIGLVALVLILSGVWVYLLVYGSPENMGEVRNALFGTSGDAPAVIAPEEVPIDTEIENTPAPAPVSAMLAKLSPRKVAGAVLVPDANVVRFIEKGTGYVYEVSLLNGIETRISHVTLPGTVEAVWAKSGMRALVRLEADGMSQGLMLGTLTKTDTGESSFTVTEIAGASDVANTAWNDVGDEILYSKISDDGGTVALLHDLKTSTTKTLFAVPFGESHILWDTGDQGSHHIYTKPAYGYVGYLYRVLGTELEKVDESHMLTAIRLNDHLIGINRVTGSGVSGFLMNTESGGGLLLQGALPKEKCAGGDVAIYCGIDTRAPAFSYPIPWYLGMVRFGDNIWRIDTQSGMATEVANPETLAREAIGITDMAQAENGQIIFKNKRDDSLWLFNPPL